MFTLFWHSLLLLSWDKDTSSLREVWFTKIVFDAERLLKLMLSVPASSGQSNPLFYPQSASIKSKLEAIFPPVGLFTGFASHINWIRIPLHIRVDYKVGHQSKSKVKSSKAAQTAPSTDILAA